VATLESMWQTSLHASRWAYVDMPMAPASGLRGNAPGPLGGLVNDRVNDERELVRRCREGSEAAYADLVRHHSRRLFSLAYRLTNDSQSAEDVVQETFLTAFKAIDKVEPNPSLSSWLNTIAIRLSGRVATRHSARAGRSLDQMMAPDVGTRAGVDFTARDTMSDPHAAAETAELRRDLDAAIAALPFKYRTAVVLRLVMGFDYAEGALAMGIPLNTFKSNLLRGTRMLRDQLAHHLRAVPPEEEPPGEGRASASSEPRMEGTVSAGFRDPAAVGEHSARR
jgi:RNA polymerase sigma factor (sigma-70 family)